MLLRNVKSNPAIAWPELRARFLAREELRSSRSCDSYA